MGVSGTRQAVAWQRQDSAELVVARSLGRAESPSQAASNARVTPVARSQESALDAYQSCLTICCVVPKTRYEALVSTLQALGEDPGRNPLLPFASVPGLHFGRLVLLPATTDLKGGTIDAQLLLITDFDGSVSAHRAALVEVWAKGLDAVFGHCEGYPQLPTTEERRRAFLERYTVRTPANYVHHPGRTVAQIQGESRLRIALESHIGARPRGDETALAVRERLRQFVARTPELSWALEPPRRVGWLRRIGEGVHGVAAPLGVLGASPVVFPAALALLGLARLQEKVDPSPHERPTRDHVDELYRLEDFGAHNGFTALGFVKPGIVRQIVIRSVIELIGYGTRHLFTKDSLAGVKSIHFARWVPLDGGRRVIFASNYDGSLESYNNDFIDLVAWGLNLVFSNGYGYPRTRWLIFGGASLEQEFKDYLRRHQVPTPIWFSAYPELSAVGIERNAALRAGLRGKMTEEQAQAWLRLL